MRSTSPFVLSIISILALASCATPSGERGPDGTRAYYINIETSDPDVRIEVNQEYVGKAPLTLKVFGDEDGTFHNFGSSDYVIRALPAATNLFPQTKTFRTGGWFAQEDKIPSAIYFDMKRQGFTLDAPRY